MRTISHRWLAASILLAVVGVLVVRLVAPEWGHALPALLITGATLPL